MLGVAAVVAVAAASTWYYLRQRPVVDAAPPPPPAAEAPAASAPAIEHPLAAAAPADAPPLPSLGDSDGPLREALAGAVDATDLSRFLVPEGLIRRVVVTIDNLPRSKVPVDKRPLAGVSGPFVAEGDEAHPVLGALNFARYEPLASAVARLDVGRVVAVYRRFYPLFQSAYQDLGYPHGYFNDRLVAAIDSLLAAPEREAPIALARPNVMYTFADPQLEALPAGQKLMLRMGPQNAAVIKAKLKDLRAAVTAAKP